MDELGVVREEGGDEALRKQVLTTQRENDKVRAALLPCARLYTSEVLQLKDQMQALQALLAQRPSLEQMQELRKVRCIHVPHLRRRVDARAVRRSTAT